MNTAVLCCCCSILGEEEKEGKRGDVYFEGSLRRGKEGATANPRTQRPENNKSREEEENGIISH